MGRVVTTYLHNILSFAKSVFQINSILLCLILAVKEEKKAAEEEVEDHIGGLFLRVSKPKSGMSRRSSQANMDELDTSRYIPPVLRDWSSSEVSS